jgi:elongation factor Ts
MEITAGLVKQLRERTGAGMMDCKAALQEAKGNLQEAETILRKQDKVKAARKAGRAANQGVVHAYIHAGARIGVLLEVNCETDFAAASDEFKQLAHDLAMHITAFEPRFVSREDVTPEVLEREREIYRAQVASLGKPSEVLEKIVEGKLESFYAQACLLEQTFVRDEGMTVRGRIERTVAKLGENVQVRRFARFKLGEDATVAAAPAGGPEPAAV